MVLPGTVSSPIESRRQARVRVHVHHTRRDLLRAQHDIVERGIPIFGLRYRINGIFP
jgi:hypothetical protein